MRKILFSASVLLVIVLGVIVVFGTSCRKNTTCVASITVLDNATSKPISGALVKIDYTGTGKQLQSGQGTTDGNGNVRISFQLEAILDVNVTHPQYQPATTIIKLEAGKTTEKTVRL